MSLCTNRNFFLCDCTPGCTLKFCFHILGKPKQILLSRWKHWWVGDWCQSRRGEKALEGWNFMFNRVVTIFGHQEYHWHDQHGYQEVLLLCCDNENVWQWKRLSRKVLRDICLVLVLLLKWGWQWGEHMSEQLFHQGFFHWQKIQIFFCTNTLNNLQKYRLRGWQRGERISEQLFDQYFFLQIFETIVSVPAGCLILNAKDSIYLSSFWASQDLFHHTHMQKNNVIFFQDFETLIVIAIAY